MVRNAAGSSIGLPHSGHSPGVSGSVSSSMVLTTSTNGTSPTAAPHSPGLLLPTAPPRLAAGRAAVDRDPAGGREPRPDQPLGDVDEIVERVGPLGELAVEEPLV